MSARIVLLSGGVGGARFADGLAQIVPSSFLTVIVNTGDDFEHWGLSICPDLDSVMYTLSGWGDEVRGWGLRDETFRTLEMMNGFGAPTWFQLGDRDLATHLFRTQALRRGTSLTEVTKHLVERFSISCRVLPMSDHPSPTRVQLRETGETLDFQDWLVRFGAPPVRALEYGGSGSATDAVLETLALADLVLIAPSNPYVSIRPILRLRGVTEILRDRVVVGVSPIIGGRAVKGPLASMIEELEGVRASAAAVARSYAGVLDGFVVASGDEGGLEEVCVRTADILMRDRKDRARVAGIALEFAQNILRGDA